MRTCSHIVGFQLAVFFASIFLSGAGYSQTASTGSVTLLSNLPIPNSNFVTDVWGYYDQNTKKEYALVAENNLGIFIIDVTDATNPALVSQVNSVPGFDVKAWQHYVYTVNGVGSGSGEIVNISDPANPQVVGSFPSSHNIFIADNGYMYLEFPGLRIYNLNPDPTDPQLVWEKQTFDGHDATVVGNRLFDFHGWSGTFIYDVSNPANPQLLGAITDPSITYHHSGWVSEDGQFLFICDELAEHPRADISVWDISDLGNPQRVGDYGDPTATVHNLIIKGNYAYTSYYTAGFRIFDISSADQISIAAEYDTNPQSGEGYAGAFGVYPLAPSGNIYVSDWDNGLFIFSFHDSSATGIDPLNAALSGEFSLRPNYPNPFNPSTTIEYELPRQSLVTIAIYNMLGEEIKTLLSTVKPAGSHSVQWDGKDHQGRQVPSGAYFYQMETEGYREAKRMILLR